MPPTPKSMKSLSGQKSLLSFFTTANNSNSTPKSNEIKLKPFGDMHENKAKRPKLDSENESTTTEPESDSPITDAPLTPEQKTMIQSKAIKAKLIRTAKTFPILDVDMGVSWFSALEQEFQKPYFKELNDFVSLERSTRTVYPKFDNVWEWTKKCAIKDVKVVILGQDPYHGPNQAHGLCFSVVKGVQPPPSLLNMYKELQDDIPGFKIPNHGYLAGWAEQGVLLLNAVLTVRAHQANSHKDKGWEKVTDAVISWISKNMQDVVFLLWGSYAQKKAAVVDKKKHHLLQAPHPSPLSAHRGFFGCKHFSKCNEILIKRGKNPIDWNHLP